METKLAQLLAEYGESHQNRTNKNIHWICVPAIFFSIFGLLRSIPFPMLWENQPLYISWSLIILALTLVYYLSLSTKLFLGFIPWAIFVFLGNEWILHQLGAKGLLFFSISIFFIAWIGQFIGHGIEGKKPSFLKDLQFLLIGPAWLLNFILRIVK